MQFDTKIAVVIRTELEAWQKLNVASFLTSGIAAAFPGMHRRTLRRWLRDEIPISDRPADPDLWRGPAGADACAGTRALARNVKPAVYTEDMFKTTHDAANREAVRAVIRAELNLVGLAMRAERKVIDKIVDGLKFHS
jgi:hypothetical protein